jgi:hypothetical protein
MKTVTEITDVARLDRMIERITQVSTWDDLLQTP